MEFILLIIAGAVVYYLYVSLQEYLKNPLKLNEKTAKAPRESYQDPYEALDAPQSAQEKYRSTELGAMQSVLLSLPNTPKGISHEVCLFLGERYRAFHLGFDYKKEEEEILKNPAAPEINPLFKATYAEYKKRLNFVGFLLCLMYLDGILDEKEKDFLLDVAAGLELDNGDFNQLYDGFEARFKEAQESLQSPSKEILRAHLVDIFDYKNQNVDFVQNAYGLYQACQSAPKTQNP